MSHRSLPRFPLGVRPLGVLWLVGFALCACAGSNSPGPPQAPAGFATQSTHFDVRREPGIGPRETAPPKGYQILHQFQGPPADGGEPFAGVIVDHLGRIFGTTLAGGVSNAGTVFGLAPAAGGGYREILVHSFACQVDGCDPGVAPYEDAAGDLFVSTESGGASDGGTALELTGPEHAREAHDLSLPVGSALGGFVAVGTTLYATSQLGANGHGAILAFSEPGLKVTDVYDFGGGPDGDYPGSYLTTDGKGALYGVTADGPTGQGTVFKFVPSESGGKKTDLFDFSAGAGPGSGVTIDAEGNIFGATEANGSGNAGTLYELKQGDGGYVETILHTFAGGAGGGYPYAPPALLNGVLYGTTYYGGVRNDGCNCGVLYRFSLSDGVFGIAHTFNRKSGGSPVSGLFVRNAALYGTTTTGEADAPGVVFRFVP